MRGTIAWLSAVVATAAATAVAAPRATVGGIGEIGFDIPLGYADKKNGLVVTEREMSSISDLTEGGVRTVLRGDWDALADGAWISCIRLANYLGFRFGARLNEAAPSLYLDWSTRGCDSAQFLCRKACPGGLEIMVDYDAFERGELVTDAVATALDYEKRGVGLVLLIK